MMIQLGRVSRETKICDKVATTQDGQFSKYRWYRKDLPGGVVRFCQTQPAGFVLITNPASCPPLSAVQNCTP